MPRILTGGCELNQLATACSCAFRVDARFLQRCLEPFPVAFEEPFRHGDEDLFLAVWEVVIERGLFDAQFVGNIAQRDSAVAAVHEEGLGDIENSLR